MSSAASLCRRNRNYSALKLNLGVTLLDVGDVVVGDIMNSTSVLFGREASWVSARS